MLVLENRQRREGGVCVCVAYSQSMSSLTDLLSQQIGTMVMVISLARYSKSTPICCTSLVVEYLEAAGPGRDPGG
jgi:hypothetical protein